MMFAQKERQKQFLALIAAFAFLLSSLALYAMEQPKENHAPTQAATPLACCPSVTEPDDPLKARVLRWQETLEGPLSLKLTRYQEIKDLEVSEQAWRDLESELDIPVWPFQRAFLATAGHFFFIHAITPPHQKLILNALKPLTESTLDGPDFENTFRAAFDEAFTNCRDIMAFHPCVRRREALQNYAFAAGCQHPVAAVLVYLGLEHLKLQSRRFKKTLLARLKQSLKKPACRITLKRLCETDDLSMYRDLKGKDLQDKGKLQALADLGLVDYNVLLADQVTGKCFVNCTTAQIFEQWDYYQKAANAKDAEGCGELASVLGAIADHKRVEAYRGHTIKQLRQKSWDLHVQADLHGREYIHAGVAIFFDEQGIPYGRTTISKHLMATLNYITKTYVDKGDIRNATHLVNKPVGVARAMISQAATHATANKTATSKIMAKGGGITTSVV